MKKIKTIIGIVVVIVIAFLYAHIGKVNPLYDKTLDNSEYIGTGVFEEKIEQTFISSEETLDGITVKCQLQGDAAGTSIMLTLIDEETDEIVAESELKAEDIENSKFNQFSFETVQGCKGKTYRVVFESVNEDVENTRGIGLLYEPKTEENTSLQINGVDTDGTMIIKTVTERFDLETFCVFLIFIIYIVFFLKFLYKLFR